jgi:hypothetical protein
LTLLGPRGLPPAFQWIAGEKTATLRKADDETCSLSSSKFALVQLRESVPWPRFRFEAEVRHDQSTEGDAGIFFAYRQFPADQQAYHSCCAYCFADQGQNKGQANWAVAKWLVTATAPGSVGQFACGGPYPIRPSRKPGPAAEWRQLAVEVTPEEIRVFWQGQFLEKMATADVRSRGQALAPPWPDGVRQRALEGGVGICTSLGTASFRNVVLRPLP